MSHPTMTPWKIHEAIIADIEDKSPGLMPGQIEIPPGNNGIPAGIYQPNDDGMWVEVKEDL